VARLDDKRMPPEVGPPMLNRLYEPDQLTLVCRQIGMSRRLVAEERDVPFTLVQHHAYAKPQGITLHHKVVVEVQQL
jgi:hypothetical protein